MSRIEDLTHLNCPISRKQIILQTINVHKLSFFENKDRLKNVYYDNSWNRDERPTMNRKARWLTVQGLSL